MYRVIETGSIACMGQTAGQMEWIALALPLMERSHPSWDPNASTIKRLKGTLV